MKSIFTLFLLPLLIACFSFTLEDEGLKVGEIAPDFEDLDQKGKLVKLSESLKKGPVILIFYRGEWCPYCNRYLGEIQDSLSVIKKKGATVIGVSFENAEQIKKTIYKTSAKFSLLSDTEKVVCQAYKTAEKSSSVPVPATYVIGTDGKIRFVHFDKNYQKRASLADILSAL